MSRKRIIQMATLAVILIGLGTAGFLASRGEATMAAGSATTSTTVAGRPVAEAETGPEPELAIAVDVALQPDEATVEGIEEGDAPRPVGRIRYDDDTTADLVLGELIVAADESDLQGFLDRHDGTLLDSFPGEDGDLAEHLVSIPVSPVEPDDVARALTAAEDGHGGEYAVSDPLLLSMFLIAADEKANHSIDVALNWLPTPNTIATGEVEDAFDRENPFEWDYLKVGGEMDTGVTGAWQLIEHYERDEADIRILIADGGFFENDDFPFQREMRLGEWNEKNPKKCSGGSACPWHGTDVAVTALGQIDNGYGTAGVAGQMAKLIAHQSGGDFWTQMRRIKRVVDEERPDVVNMSFSWDVKTFRAASEKSTDRHLKAMKNDGALVFAAAGNDGSDVDTRACIGKHCYETRLTIPCESKYAICVGGYDERGWLHDGSNYGPSGGGRSVQMYAPFCVITPYNPVNRAIKDTHWTCGTSVSSPFVAGAAALVKAADPDLSPDEVWEILVDTAHVGGLHFDHLIPTENQLRINVMDAVAVALGVEQTAPVVEITAPANGFETGPTEWFELEGTAVDFKGQPLKIKWTSSLEGHIGTGLDPQAVFEPVAGTHTITATATDVNGNKGTATITVEVIDLPPEMTISWPAAGTLVYETEDLDLVGLSEDPDTYQSLGDDAVEWEIVRNGNVVFTGSGHMAEVPGGTLNPGKHTVILRGTDGGGAGETSVDITVAEVIGHVPSAIITTDLKKTYGYGSGSGVELSISGVGTDFEDGQLAGTSYRWLAVTDGGAQVVEICRGSTFDEAEAADTEFNPGLVANPSDEPVGPPVLGTLKDCSTVDLTLGLAPGHVGQTQWSIVLEVSDSDNQVGRDVVDVLITYAVA